MRPLVGSSVFTPDLVPSSATDIAARSFDLLLIPIRISNV